MSGGWWTVTTIRGAPLRFHWTIPLGAFLMGRLAFVPAFWLGFVLLILVHELGHALLVLRYRLGLSELRVHGAGGECRHDDPGTPYQGAVVAWGGVLAQLCLLLATQLVILLVGPPSSAHTMHLAYAFTETNLWIMGFNLLPIGHLDGVKAWQLVPMLMARYRKRRQARSAARRPSVQDELRSLEKLDTHAESPDQKTDRIVRDLISRTTRSKSDR